MTEEEWKDFCKKHNDKTFGTNLDEKKVIIEELTKTSDDKEWEDFCRSFYEEVEPVQKKSSKLFNVFKLFWK